MRWVVTLLCVAACSGDAFVEIRISAPASVDRVEVFIAPKQCEPGLQVPKCAQEMSWDQTSRKYAGTVYILDIDATTVADKIGEGRYRIQLQRRPLPENPDDPDDPDAGYDRSKVERLLIVGYAGPDVAGAAILKDVHFPANTVEQWNVELAAFDAIPATVERPPGDTNRLHIWNRSADTLARCAVVEHWHNNEANREFLVPPNDTDCDDNAPPDSPNVECDPYYWNKPVTAPTDPSCSTSSFPVRGHSTPTCQLGGMACSELAPMVGTSCTPVAPVHCAASAMCVDACRSNPQDCINSRGMAQVLCTAPTDAQGQPCPQLNFATAFLAQLATPPAAPSVSCNGLPLFTSLTLPITGFTPTGALGTVTITPSIGGDACEPTLTWSGTVTDQIHFGAMAVPLGNGTTAVVGFAIRFAEGACDANTPMSCELLVPDGDDVLQCAMAPAEI